MANAHEIARSCGVVLKGRKTRHPASDALPSRHTWSRHTINDTYRRGINHNLPEHVYDVLGLICSADDTQLFQDVISGVSEWGIANRINTHEVPFILPAFRGIDLKAVRQEVRRFKIPQRGIQVGFIVSGIMSDAVTALRNP